MDTVGTLGEATGGVVADQTALRGTPSLKNESFSKNCQMVFEGEIYAYVSNDSRVANDYNSVESSEPKPEPSDLQVSPPAWTFESEKESKELTELTFECRSHSEMDFMLREGTEDDGGSDLSGVGVLPKVMDKHHDLEIGGSPDEVIFGGNDFNEYLHENGASFDIFSDALDASIDADGSQNADNMKYHVDIEDWLYKNPCHELRYSQKTFGYLKNCKEIKGTGRPDLYGDGDEIDERLDVCNRQSTSSDECFLSANQDGSSYLSLGSKRSRHSSEQDDQQHKEYDIDLYPESNRIRFDAEPVQAQSENFDAVRYESSNRHFEVRQACAEGELFSEKICEHGPLEEGHKNGDKCPIDLRVFQKNETIGVGTSILPLSNVDRGEAARDFGYKFGMHEDNELVLRPVNTMETCDVDETNVVEDLIVDSEASESNSLHQDSDNKSPKGCRQGLGPDIESKNGIGWRKEDLGPDELSRYVETLELKESYIDTVLDMEDVLLNFEDSDGAYYHMTSKGLSQGPALHNAENMVNSLLVGNRHQSSAPSSIVVDSVEVIGARQKSGGTSISERFVGAKEHTIYNIKVKAGTKEWEVERRYRDFVDLYRQLKKMLVSHMRLSLPAPWEKVDMESRKLFGNTSPDVVEVRSVLLQVCLESLVEAGPPFSTSAPLLQFLSFQSVGSQPFSAVPDTAAERSENGCGVYQLQLKELKSFPATQPVFESERSTAEIGDHDVKFSVFGKTIRLIVNMHPIKPLKQQLAVQHHTCAGCYGQLDSATGFVSGIATTFGLGGPRLCDYSRQLFCMKCHLNETAVIPARVLQMWDFTPRRVSQLAKAYLDSIYDQPMLCVSAVNPFLYSRVPLLAHVRGMRRKLSKMFDCVRCPSRSAFQQVIGSRRHLFEDNDFFALHDLEDLSKGAFSVLPSLLEMLSNKLLLHISKNCSVCHEVAEACADGPLCAYPSTMMFPFEEQNIHRCITCHSLFHEDCFKKSGFCRVCNLNEPTSVPAEDFPRYGSESKPSSSSQKDDEGYQSSYGLESDDKISVQGDNRPRPAKYLARLFRSRENYRERQNERRTAKILNMSAILGPLEL